MMTFLEIGILCAIIATTAIGGRLTSEYGPGKIATWGAIAVAASYVHLAVVGALLGVIVAVRRRAPTKKP